MYETSQIDVFFPFHSVICVSPTNLVSAPGLEITKLKLSQIDELHSIEGVLFVWCKFYVVQPTIRLTALCYYTVSKLLGWHGGKTPGSIPANGAV